MNFFIRLTRLIFGLFLYALGTVLTIQAHIGYAPWDIFHAGLAHVFNIKIGTASILTGLFIILLTVFLGEKIGIGTVLNMLLIGLFMNFLFFINCIPRASSLVLSLGMLIIGLFIIALASFFYIGSGFGAGPRDTLMIALTRITRFSVGTCRAVIEIVVLLVGWALGGLFGFGTVLSAVLIGFCVEITFKILKFDVTKIKHESISDTIKLLF